MTCLSVRSALANAFGIPLRVSTSASTLLLQNSTRSTRHQCIPPQPNSNNTSFPFSTSSSRSAKKKGKVQTDKRITLIRYHLHHPTTLTPRPLRFSRNRALRHWTIHRAWNLHRATVKRNRERELERQYNAMAAANEELRVGAGDGGKLFRRAQMKTGTWSIPERGGGIPIEYARAMTEYIGSVGVIGGVGGRAKIWDTEWKRL